MKIASSSKTRTNLMKCLLKIKKTRQNSFMHFFAVEMHFKTTLVYSNHLIETSILWPLLTGGIVVDKPF